RAGRPINGTVIRQIVEAAGVPCQLGGGIRTDTDLADVFNWGVQWAVLGTRALQRASSLEKKNIIPPWCMNVALRYPQRIVLGIDAKNGLVATEGWLALSE